MEQINITENTVFSSELTAKDITQIIVDKWKDSAPIKEMRIANKYFDCYNEKIEKKTRVYYDKDRNPIQNPTANNAKVKSNFLRMLVQQKQDYGFAKTFILKLSDEEYKKELITAFPEIGDDTWGKYLEILQRLNYTNDCLGESNAEEANICSKIFNSILRR